MSRERPRWPCVLFDLDGTLTDSAPGIMRCIRHAFAALDLPAPADAALREWIGPPLNESFARAFAGDQALARRAVAMYRERYAEFGWRENRLIDGIDGLLGRLDRAGARAFVVTSKPEVYARRIVGHFGLDGRIERVCGADADGTRAGKAGLIGALLAAAALAPERTAMVGDRRHDVEGARAHGVAALGVTWGYGSRDELETAGADAIVAAPAALERLLLN